MQDFDALLREATLPEQVVPICLNGRLVRQYEQVKGRVDARAGQAADNPNDTRLGAKQASAADPEQEELDRLTAQLQGESIPFLVQASPRDKFVEFVAMPEFAARKNAKTGEVDGRDRHMGVNVSTFIPALVRTSIAEPDLSDDTRWQKLLAVLSNAQMERLFAAAWAINSEDRDIPFSPSGSPSPPS